METYYFICLLSAVIVFSAFLPFTKGRQIKRKVKRLTKGGITPKEFFAMRNASDGGRGKEHISNKYDFTGVYILYNKTKNMYYVGQAKRIFSRVNSHFTGHGNGDVYADFKYGDKFVIRMVRLKGSGCKTLNELERKTITFYNSFAKGYNKTRGNKG